MKVKIKELHPNPYRSIQSYPVDEQKVLSLMESIKQTGFWDNILARQIDGEIQIAYGHHRLTALRRLMDPEDEVDIPVKELDDATMIKIMANENVDEWKATPSVIDQTVKVTREFLIDHPEIASKYGQVKKSSQTGEDIIGADLIARFLNWKPTRISEALERLHLIDNGEATQLTFEYLNTPGSARAVVDEIKKQKELGTPIPLEKQEEVAKKFSESGNKKHVLNEAVREVVRETYQIPKQPNENIKAIANAVNEMSYKMDGLSEGLDGIRSLYRKSGEVPEEWKGMNWHVYLVDRLQKIMMKIDAFIKEYASKPTVVGGKGRIESPIAS